MKIGYLHVSHPQDGVRRYGEMLAAECGRRAGVEAVEAPLEFSEQWTHDRRAMAVATEAISAADLVHVQYCRRAWGRGWRNLRRIGAFLERCKVPVVVTLHDVTPDEPGRNETSALARIARLPGEALRFIRRRYPEKRALACLLRRASSVLACSEHERACIRREWGFSKCVVIPHFVERRSPRLSREEARAKLGFGEDRILTILGYINPRKVPRLAVEALARMPTDVKLVLAGRANRGLDRYCESLLDLARELGVRDRLVLTGYLPEEKFEEYLVATDLALCPFKSASASGSLSTWISVAKRVLASDIPLMGEYNDLAPGAVEVFAPYEAGALAARAVEILESDGTTQISAVAKLREDLSISRVADKHLGLYGRVVDDREAGV